MSLQFFQDDADWFHAVFEPNDYFPALRMYITLYLHQQSIGCIQRHHQKNNRIVEEPLVRRLCKQAFRSDVDERI